MKQKIAILMACLLISCAAAGCGNSNSSDSSKAESGVSESKTEDNSETADGASEEADSSSDTASKEGKESDAESKAESENEDSEEVVEATFDEDGNLVFDIGDPDDWEDDSEEEFDDGESEEDIDTGTDDFINSYTLLMLSPKDFKSKESLPVHYVITSEAELNDFIENHTADYALDVEYTGDSFIEAQSFIKRASDTIKNDLPVYDYLLIITDHSKSIEPDVGAGSVKDNSVSVDLWVTKPSSDSDKAYSCIMIPVEKEFLKGKDISVINVDPPIEEAEDE